MKQFIVVAGDPTRKVWHSCYVVACDTREEAEAEQRKWIEDIEAKWPAESQLSKLPRIYEVST